MKTYEILNEIELIASREYSPKLYELETYLWDRLSSSDISLAKLPGGSNYLYSVLRVTNNYDIAIVIWDPNPAKLNAERPGFYQEIKEKLGKIPGAIAGVMLLERARFPLKDAYHVSSVSTLKEYRGQRIALSLYGIALTILDLVLVSDTVQTPGGAKMWNYLYSISSVDVRGYIKLNAEKLDDEIIDILMGKLGAEHVGEYKDTLNRVFHYFAFAVVSNTTKNQLVSDINTKLSKLYDSDSNFIKPTQIGLYATLNR